MQEADDLTEVEGSENVRLNPYELRIFRGRQFYQSRPFQQIVDVHADSIAKVPAVLSNSQIALARTIYRTHFIVIVTKIKTILSAHSVTQKKKQYNLKMKLRRPFKEIVYGQATMIARIFRF